MWILRSSSVSCTERTSELPLACSFSDSLSEWEGACGYLGASGGITIVYLSIFSLHLDLPLLGIVAFLPLPSHRFPKCHLSLLFVFTLVISLGLPSKVPRKRSNCGHGISEVAVKFGKLVILCRKKYSLGLFPIIYRFLFWFGFLFLFCFGLIFFWTLDHNCIMGNLIYYANTSQPKCLCTLFT